MLKIKEYVKVESLAQAYELNQKKRNVVLGGMLWLKLQNKNVDTLILAIGHSARDTFEKLYKKGFSMEKKNFSVGVRIEHLQEMINLSQYGNATKLKLPPAEYKLAYHSPNGRSCYTFCMCPGGTVMASSSEKNTIVTNGMSNYLRDSGIIAKLEEMGVKEGDTIRIEDFEFEFVY